MKNSNKSLITSKTKVSPVVAIIGRPNTGKSTLANRLIERKKSVISKIAGTTRDKVSGLCYWQDKTFTVIDTGGVRLRSESNLEKDVQAQTELAIKEADIIVFLTDGRQGINSEDIIIAQKLKKIKKPIILAVNKCDSKKLMDEAAEFYRIGFKETNFLSAGTGIGTGDLLDTITKYLPPSASSEITEPSIRIGIFGRPNCGKSSLLNRLLGYQRAIVSDISGTTRDILEEQVTFDKQDVLLSDTAGIRRKNKISKDIDVAATKQSFSAIKKYQVIIFVLDITTDISRQDIRLLRNIVHNSKGIVLVANKWDLVEKSKIENKISRFEEYVRNKMGFISWAPIILTSAKTNFNVEQILKVALAVYQEKNKTIEQEELTKFLFDFLTQHPYPEAIETLIQTKTNPPAFKIILEKPNKKIAPPYLNTFERAFRAKFGFSGVPINISYK